ncbi:MAG TPA: hypothetical protein VFI70_01610 [Nitrososphaeraceae archaeon]|nr:hypothetical protein [Nitrososphaeraceae archaeon]
MAEKTSTSKSNNAYSAKLKSRYQNFLQEAATLFPKVDQKLLLNILQFETVYSDWEGSVMLKIVYPAGTDLDTKKEWIYKKYQRVSSVEENRTLRFKGIRVYIEELEKLLKEDQEIEYITGSATLTPSDAYAT